MKHLKLFEEFGRYTKYLEQIKNAKVGDVLPEEVIYMYVEYLNDYSPIHTHEDSFIDGDLGDRIEQYSNYKLEKVPIDRLDLSEWELYDDTIEEYTEEYEETKEYPPIVLDSDYGIIDGIHRANAICDAGESEILAFVGF